MKRLIENDTIGHNVKLLDVQIHKGMNEAFKEYDITYSQCMVLRFITEHADEKVCLVDIEKNFRLSHPTIVGLVKRLEEKKYIKTTLSTKDRRYKYIEITEQAEKFEQQMVDRALTIEEQLVNGLSNQEIEEWFRITRKMTNNIEMKGTEFND